LGGGFYWSPVVEDLVDAGIPIPSPDEVPREWLQQVVDDTASCPFRAVDVARTSTGDWIVVELNDGQMAGLSCVPLAGLYQRLFGAVSTHRHSTS
jgi:hypothetical protein